MSLVQEMEHVLVVPTSLFHEIGYFQGFCGGDQTERYLARLLAADVTSYRPRDDMERDPSFKQLIPYVVFRHTDAAGQQSVFQYTRGKGQGEKRLHSKRSIGVGGHISSVDAGANSAYEEGLARELLEEVVIDTTYTQACVGLINDDLTEVGKVHLGVVHIFDVAEPKVSQREVDLLSAGFAPVEELLANLDGFETWSQITLQALFGKPKG